MIYLEDILKDPDVTFIIQDALNKYKEWRQVVDYVTYFVFCCHDEFKVSCNDTCLKADLLRADLRKHLRKLWMVKRNEDALRFHPEYLVYPKGRPVL